MFTKEARYGRTCSGPCDGEFASGGRCDEISRPWNSRTGLNEKCMDEWIINSNQRLFTMYR